MTNRGARSWGRLSAKSQEQIKKEWDVYALVDIERLLWKHDTGGWKPILRLDKKSKKREINK